MHYLGTECNAGYEKFLNYSAMTIPQLRDAGRVVLADGGTALNASLGKLRPEVAVNTPPTIVP